MTGSTDHVRVGTRSVGEGTCPDYFAAKAHPALWPAERLRARKEKLDTFPLGVLNAALDEIEINGAAVAQAIDRAVEETEQEGKRSHPGVLTWARTAADRYLAGVARYQDQDRSRIPATVPVRDYWVAREDHRSSGGRLWEMYAYGRRYESPDGSVREIRLLHYGTFEPLQPIQERQETGAGELGGPEASRARGTGGYRRLQRGVRSIVPLAKAMVPAVPAVSRSALGCQAGPHGPGGSGRARRWQASPGV
jgi:hypothetical protein